MKDDSGHSPYLKIDPTQPQPALIKAAAMALKAGRCVIFPTDTVYGLGILVSKTANTNSIYKLKQRPAKKNVPLLVFAVEDLQRYAQNLPQYAIRLAKQHWPGALTLVVQASPELPKQFVAADGSVALRMPASPIALALIEAANAPLATSSANISGCPPALSVSELDTKLATGAALIIDGGVLAASQPSTVVSCLGKEPRVLRAGKIDPLLWT